jgi:hypothetical protein
LTSDSMIRRDFFARADKVLPVKDTDSDRPITAAAESAHVVCQDSGWEAGNRPSCYAVLTEFLP